LDNPLNGPLALSLKAGDFYSVYFFDESFSGIESFMFTTAGVATVTTGGPNSMTIPLDLSHASLFQDPSFTPDPVPDPDPDPDPDPGPLPGPNVVPEPTSIAIWSLLGLGCAGYGARRRRRNRTA